MIFGIYRGRNPGTKRRCYVLEDTRRLHYIFFRIFRRVNALPALASPAVRRRSPGSSAFGISRSEEARRRSWEANLAAKARVTSRIKTVVMIERDATDGRGDFTARASSTCLVLGGTMAEGR